MSRVTVVIVATFVCCILGQPVPEPEPEPTPVVPGCTDGDANNYDAGATEDDGSCVGKTLGCIDALAINFDPTKNTDDGSCEPDPCLRKLLNDCSEIGSTCTSFNSTVYTCDCIPGFSGNGTYCGLLGCTSDTAMNFEPLAQVADGSCTFALDYYECPIRGALADDNLMPVIREVHTAELCAQLCLNYDDCLSFDHSEKYAKCYIGSGILADGENTYSQNYEYFQRATDMSRACTPGCTDPTMFNYSPRNNLEDGSCFPFIRGCTNYRAFNYDPVANTDDGGCQAVRRGCMKPASFNYDPRANTPTDNCIPRLYGCMREQASNYNASSNTEDGTCIYSAVILPNGMIRFHPGPMNCLARIFVPSVTQCACR
jgi:hypothetical protein